jgi:hypothetical protein
MESTSLIVNLFGGTGVGKGEMAAYVLSLLKVAGRDIELVKEPDNLSNYHRINNLIGKVDFILVYYPLLLQTLDAEDNQAVIDLSNQKYEGHNSFNILVNRVVLHTSRERVQESSEALEIDNKAKELLHSYDIPYFILEGSKEGGEALAHILLDMITHSPYEGED